MSIWATMKTHTRCNLPTPWGIRCAGSAEGAGYERSIDSIYHCAKQRTRKIIKRTKKSLRPEAPG